MYECLKSLVSGWLHVSSPWTGDVVRSEGVTTRDLDRTPIASERLGLYDVMSRMSKHWVRLVWFELLASQTDSYRFIRRWVGRSDLLSLVRFFRPERSKSLQFSLRSFDHRCNRASIACINSTRPALTMLQIAVPQCRRISIVRQLWGCSRTLSDFELAKQILQSVSLHPIRFKVKSAVVKIFKS